MPQSPINFEMWAEQIIERLAAPPARKPIIEDLPPLNDPDWPSIWEIFDELDDEAHIVEIDPDRLLSDDPAAGPSGPMIPLDEDEFEASARAGASKGFEAWAFYKSIHMRHMRPFRGRWGIFLFDHGIATVRDYFLHFHGHSVPPHEAQWHAERILHRHERFHFRVDMWTIAQEATLGYHLYMPYLRQIYSRIHPSRLCVEESLANQHMLRSLRRSSIRPFLENLMSGQPPAYRNFKIKTAKARAELAAQILDLKAGVAPREDLGPWVAYGRESLQQDRNCPTQVILRCRPSKLFPKAAGFPTHKDFNAYVQSYLSGEKARRTDHTYWRIDNGEIIKEPNKHKGLERLKRGEFQGSVAKAGMTSGEYWKERQRTREWKKKVPRPHPRPSRIAG